MEIVTSLVAGIFVLIAAYLAWRLRISEKHAALMVEKRKEKEELYKKIHRTFDGMIQAVKRHERTAMQKEVIELNAEVALLASDEFGALYEESCQNLEEWTAVFPKAWPDTNLLQAPDPTAKYKEQERAAYQQFLENLQKLNTFMKADLNENT